MIITRAIYLLLKILPIQFQSIVLYLRKKYVFYNNVLRIPSFLHIFIKIDKEIMEVINFQKRRKYCVKLTFK